MVFYFILFWLAGGGTRRYATRAALGLSRACRGGRSGYAPALCSWLLHLPACPPRHAATLLPSCSALPKQAGLYLTTLRSGLREQTTNLAFDCVGASGGLSRSQRGAMSWYAHIQSQRVTLQRELTRRNGDQKERSFCSSSQFTHRRRCNEGKIRWRTSHSSSANVPLGPQG